MKRIKFDHRELVGKIVSKFRSVNKFRTVLGISYVGLNNKLNGKSYFTGDEIYAICDLLGVTNGDEVKKLFFTISEEDK